MRRRRGGLVSIHRGLLYGMLQVVFVLSGAIMASTFFTGREVIEDMAGSLMREATKLVDAKLRRYIDPAAQGLGILSEWGREGLLDPEKPELLRRKIWPFLDRFRQFAAIMVSDEDGNEFLVGRDGDRWRVRERRPGRWGARTRTAVYTDIRSGEPEVRFQEEVYDPKTRPWFRGAMQAEPGRLALTEVYPFLKDGAPGVTMSVRYLRKGRRHVVGIDLLLEEIERFARGLHVHGRGGVVLLGDRDTIVGLPGDRRFGGSPDQRLPQPGDLATSLVRDALKSLAVGEPARFFSEGRYWWGLLHKLAYSGPNGRPGDSSGIRQKEMMRVLVLVPESSILNVHRRWLILAAITVLVLLLGLWRVNRLARRYSGPIEQLVAQVQRLGRGDLSPQPPIETRVRELRQLARAQEDAREALSALVKLEGDLQVARRIQQDTWPTELPNLPGYQLTAWSEPAEETGGDSYDLLGFADGLPTKGDQAASNAGIMLADATGHGIGPALSAAQVRAMLRMGVRGKMPLVDIVDHLNRQLCEDLREGRFITLWIAHLEVSTHRLLSFSAGQSPLIHFRARKGRCEVMNRPDSPPLGIVPDLPITPKDPIAMGPGDIFAVFSDGIFEAPVPGAGSTAERFGEERVSEILCRHHDRSPSEILGIVRAAVAEFTKGAPAHDDRSAVILKRL